MTTRIRASSLGRVMNFGLPFHPPPPGPSGPPPLPPTHSPFLPPPPPAPAAGRGFPPVSLQTGQFFRFAWPQGWQVQENTNMLCVNAPDGSAALMAVGLVGLMMPFTPDQFLLYAMQLAQLGQVRILQGQPIPPAPGCSSAGMFEVAYGLPGGECQGLIFSHVALGYGQCNGSIAMAAARSQLWNQVRDWLAPLAQQIAPAGPHTFMASTVAAQNLRNSIAEGQHFHAVNDYIQHSQQQTTNERWASDARNQFDFRENLGGVATHYDPFAGRALELSPQYTYYWINRQGEVVGSNDPGFDPSHGSTQEWSRMPRTRG